MSETKTYLIVCALKSEYEALITKVKDGRAETHAGISGWGFPLPTGRALAIKGRIGKVATAFELGALSQGLHIVGIINTGVAGALATDLKPLEVVIATKVAFYDVDLTAFGQPLGQMDGEPLWFMPDDRFIAGAQEFNRQTTSPLRFGSIISGDRFVTKDNLAPAIVKQFGQPLCSDMESGAIAQVAHHLQIPFCIIRSISDQTFTTANEKHYQDYLAPAADRAAIVTLQILAHCQDK